MFSLDHIDTAGLATENREDVEYLTAILQEFAPLRDSIPTAQTQNSIEGAANDSNKKNVRPVIPKLLLPEKCPKQGGKNRSRSSIVIHSIPLYNTDEQTTDNAAFSGTHSFESVHHSMPDASHTITRTQSFSDNEIRLAENDTCDARPLSHPPSTSQSDRLAPPLSPSAPSLKDVTPSPDSPRPQPRR